jgi:hypothetical protein
MVLKTTKSQSRFPLGLIVFSCGVALYKAISLSLEMGDSLSMATTLLLLDSSFIGVLFLLATGYSFPSHSWLRMAIKAVLLCFVVFFTIHSFVLLALDEYMNLFDLGRYLQEWQVVLSFFDVLIVSVCLVFLIAVFIDCPLAGRIQTAILIASILAFAGGLAVLSKTPFQLQKYAVIQFESLASQFSGQKGFSTYSPEQLAFYSSAAAGPVEFIEPEQNIILLIVESLSSINSRKTSGQGDLMQVFDNLANQGLLFRNYFANHSASEGGIISLLSGFPPLHYPGATPMMFDEFALQGSVIAEYRQRGYFTEFLTNTDLGFIGMDRYISGLQFDQARGRDEVEALQQAPRFVQNAPSDRYLYSVALGRAAELDAQYDDSGQPWLMTLATVSTHLPYNHPEGGENTEGAVWEWSLERLSDFYDGLQSQGFFDNGILLIVGDHRQMRPITAIETQRYGDSAKARIPLLVIGRDIPQGQVDERFFQQSDLLRMLNRIPQQHLDLSPHPVWVERYNRMYGKVDSINRFGVFDSADSGLQESPVQISGTSLSWSGSRPAFFRKIEAQIHAQRSSHQFVRSDGKQGCTIEYQPWAESVGSETGLHLSLLQENSLEFTENLGSSGRQNRTIENIHAIPVESDETHVFWYRAFLQIEEPGLYWFRAAPVNQVCMGIDQQLILDQLIPGAGTQGSIELEAGVHALDVRFLMTRNSADPTLQWVTPGLTRWRWTEIPLSRFRLPSPNPDFEN